MKLRTREQPRASSPTPPPPLLPPSCPASPVLKRRRRDGGTASLASVVDAARARLARRVDAADPNRRAHYERAVKAILRLHAGTQRALHAEGASSPRAHARLAERSARCVEATARLVADATRLAKFLSYSVTRASTRAASRCIYSAI